MPTFQRPCVSNWSSGLVSIIRKKVRFKQVLNLCVWVTTKVSPKAAVQGWCGDSAQGNPQGPSILPAHLSVVFSIPFSPPSSEMGHIPSSRIREKKKKKHLSGRSPAPGHHSTYDLSGPTTAMTRLYLGGLQGESLPLHTRLDAQPVLCGCQEGVVVKDSASPVYAPIPGPCRPGSNSQLHHSPGDSIHRPLYGGPRRLCEPSFIISQLPWLRRSFHNDSVLADSLPFPFSSPLGPWKGRSHLFRAPGQWESPFRTARHLALTAANPWGKCNTAERVPLLFSLSCAVALSGRGLILTCNMALCPIWTPWYLAARVMCLMSLLKDPKTALQLFP